MRLADVTWRWACALPPQDGHARQAGGRFLEQFQPLGVLLPGVHGQARGVPTWPGQAGDEPAATGSAVLPNRSESSWSPAGQRGWSPDPSQDEVDPQTAQLRRQLGETGVDAIGVARLDDVGLTLNVAELTESLGKRRDLRSSLRCRAALRQIADAVRARRLDQWTRQDTAAGTLPSRPGLCFSE